MIAKNIKRGIMGKTITDGKGEVKSNAEYRSPSGSELGTT
jgi:hypothetical protein